MNKYLILQEESVSKYTEEMATLQTNQNWATWRDKSKLYPFIFNVRK